jgi:hypothetical protein
MDIPLKIFYDLYLKISVSMNNNFQAIIKYLQSNYKPGRAIAQAVSRWLPTMAARVQTPGLVMWDFMMDKSGAGAGFI